MSVLTRAFVFGLSLIVLVACGQEPQHSKKTGRVEAPAPVVEKDKENFDVLPDENKVEPVIEPVEDAPDNINVEDPEDIDPLPLGSDVIDGLRVMNSESEETFSSVDHPYGVFVVEAYFLGCPYCNQNTQNVDQLSEDFAESDQVHVLDISIDCRESDYRNWISRHNPNHRVLNDCGGQKLLRKTLNITSYPTTVVLDCHGEEVYRMSGLWNLNQMDQIKNAVDLAKADCAK